MRPATEGSLPPVMPQGNLVEVLGREVRQGSPGELMVESSPSRQRRPPCKTNKEMSHEAADVAALTYLLTYLPYYTKLIRCKSCTKSHKVAQNTRMLMTSKPCSNYSASVGSSLFAGEEGLCILGKTAGFGDVLL